MATTINDVKFTLQTDIKTTVSTPSAGVCRVRISLPEIRVNNTGTSVRYAWYTVVDEGDSRVYPLVYKRLTGGSSGGLASGSRELQYEKDNSSHTKTYRVLIFVTTTSSPPTGTGTLFTSKQATIPALSAVTIKYQLEVDGAMETIRTETRTEAFTATCATLAQCDYFSDDPVLCKRFNYWYNADSPSVRYAPSESYVVPATDMFINADICPPMFVKTEPDGWQLGCPYVKYNGEWVKPLAIKGKLDGEWADVKTDIVQL